MIDILQKLQRVREEDERQREKLLNGRKGFLSLVTVES